MCNDQTEIYYNHNVCKSIKLCQDLNTFSNKVNGAYESTMRSVPEFSFLSWANSNRSSRLL